MDAGIGQFIIRRRDELNLTQTALAEMVGLKRSHLSLIESGKIALPGAGVRREIARVLGVRHVDLLVIAGELSEDEIDPRRQPVYSDNRLQMIADDWQHLDELDKLMFLRILELNRRARGLDGLDDIVQVVSESVGARRASG